MSGHTPGPWTLEAGELQPLLVQAHGYTVAATFGNPRQDYRDRIAEASANARLIAAAPELLAALKAMLGIDNPDAPDVGHVDYVRAVAMGKAAIAKAEGK